MNSSGPGRFLRNEDNLVNNLSTTHGKKSLEGVNVESFLLDNIKTPSEISPTDDHNLGIFFQNQGTFF